MKKRLISISIAVVVLLIGVSFALPKKASQTSVGSYIITQQPDKTGESALDLLARTEKITVKEFSFGKLVESINGVKNGTDNKYWILYINGTQSKVGASEYIIQKNDIIEWRFEEYQQ